ncbi:MAG: DUF2304 domain-containing protein [Betaproteobacteria bacterium]|nr:DUF2304 domain-containing protein [Betaproteobacteria bacterium]
MIVSLIASGLFLFVLFVAAVRKFTFLGLKVAVMLFAAAGIYFVWNPDQMTRLAHLVGVGRGADLITYGTTVILFLTVVAAIIRERRSNDVLTQLVRRLAVQQARFPVPPKAGRGGRG